ncbi:hypothetical protein DN069_00805 [Streptacidiphilus pinicola]|uniref:Secreted protein n=1 Tax=Streptacidiphilus pinicola TaxID=2219663 RepID=A0A2X0IVJ1_9ACTN|nr:hypothetical protein [Streptacidiphilus pinicola]RAG87563.1 hypothetical protein DN069_00805 [Streptacidiphilus pinicola]
MKRHLSKFMAVLAAAVFAAVTLTPASAAAPAAQTRATASTRVSPGPDCANNGNTNPCWEYQTWFWTFDNCNNYYNEHPYDPSRYDNHICAVFTNGLTVGLWFHKYSG